MGVNLTDKVQHIGLYSVGKVDEILKSKLIDESVEFVNFSC